MNADELAKLNLLVYPPQITTLKNNLQLATFYGEHCKVAIGFYLSTCAGNEDYAGYAEQNARWAARFALAVILDKARLTETPKMIIHIRKPSPPRPARSRRSPNYPMPTATTYCGASPTSYDFSLADAKRGYNPNEWNVCKECIKRTETPK